jgi:hypothetical protein
VPMLVHPQQRKINALSAVLIINNHEINTVPVPGMAQNVTDIRSFLSTGTGTGILFRPDIRRVPVPVKSNILLNFEYKVGLIIRPDIRCKPSTGNTVVSFQRAGRSR